MCNIKTLNVDLSFHFFDAACAGQNVKLYFKIAHSYVRMHIVFVGDLKSSKH
jgi:hypothetical protein